MTGEVKIISRTHRKINGKYYARVRYKIDDGKPVEILRCVENKSAIRPKQAEIEYDLLKNGPLQLVAGKITSFLCEPLHTEEITTAFGHRLTGDSLLTKRCLQPLPRWRIWISLHKW